MAVSCRKGWRQLAVLRWLCSLRCDWNACLLSQLDRRSCAALALHAKRGTSHCCALAPRSTALLSWHLTLKSEAEKWG